MRDVVASLVFQAMATSPSTSSKLLTARLTVFIAPPLYVLPEIRQKGIDILESIRLHNIAEMPAISFAVFIV